MMLPSSFYLPSGSYSYLVLGINFWIILRKLLIFFWLLLIVQNEAKFYGT